MITKNKNKNPVKIKAVDQVSTLKKIDTNNKVIIKSLFRGSRRCTNVLKGEYRPNVRLFI